MIHPTAVIHPRAQLDGSVSVGPYAVIDADVEIGPGCALGPHVYVTGRTRVGANNRFCAGAVIGEAPQDLKYRGEVTGLRIGDGNNFREHVTVNRSSSPEQDTCIGSHGLFMAACHIAHNGCIGDRVIMANGVLLGGHVQVGHHAFLSGHCLVHQFVRIGDYAMMQGGAAISKDLPPFTMARGDNHICGLNVVGLRRAGFTSAERLELKALYHGLFRRRVRLQDALAAARPRFTHPLSQQMIDFVASAQRGVCCDVSQGEADGGS